MTNKMKYFETKRGLSIECEYGNEKLIIQNNKERKRIELFLGARKCQYPLNLWEKLKYCFSIFRNNKQQNDQFVLSKETALALATDLRDMAHRL